MIILNPEANTINAGSFVVGNRILNSAANTYLHFGTANVLDQHNSVNPQAFRIYNTYTDATTFERLNIKWDTNVLKIGTEKGTSGGVARAMEFQTDGVTRLSFSADNIIAHISSTNLITGTQIRIGGQTRLSNRSDGVLQISDSSEAGLNRIQLGGTTSSFPALKRNGAALQIRLADDSANAALETSTLTATGGDIEITSATSGVIFKTPDGTKRYRMTIDNAGAPVFTLLA